MRAVHDNAPERNTVLFVVPDCPGHFVKTVYEIARRLAADGLVPVFAVTSRYYERFKGVQLEDLGRVHYLSDFVASCPDEAVRDVELDYWLTHVTYVRTRYVEGRHINTWDSYRKVVLFFRALLRDHEQIGAVWSEMPSSATICIAEAEAKRVDVPFLGFISARIPHHFNVVTDRFNTMLEAPHPSTYVPEPDDAPDYMTTAREAADSSPWAALNGAPTKLWRALRSASAPSIETGNTMSWVVRASLARAKRNARKLVVRAEQFASPLPARSASALSICFPLQYRPEASSSVLAQFYENDVETIRNIAFSLPHRAHLYVKCHPSALGSHRRAFFEELLSFPQVRILSASPPLSHVLENLDALICLTSTAGFEALQQGVPVFLLGRTFYEDYPGVTRLNGWADVGPALRTLEPGSERRANPEPMRRYLRTCFPGTFNYMMEAVVHPQNIDRLCEPVRCVMRLPT